MQATIKLYRGLLVSMAHHPQIYTKHGVLLLQHCTPQDAVPFLNKVVGATPEAVQN